MKKVAYVTRFSRVLSVLRAKVLACPEAEIPKHLVRINNVRRYLHTRNICNGLPAKPFHASTVDEVMSVRRG